MENVDIVIVYSLSSLIIGKKSQVFLIKLIMFEGHDSVSCCFGPIQVVSAYNLFVVIYKNYCLVSCVIIWHREAYFNDQNTCMLVYVYIYIIVPDIKH